MRGICIILIFLSPHWLFSQYNDSIVGDDFIRDLYLKYKIDADSSDYVEALKKLDTLKFYWSDRINGSSDKQIEVNRDFCEYLTLSAHFYSRNFDDLHKGIKTMKQKLKNKEDEASRLIYAKTLGLNGKATKNTDPKTAITDLKLAISIEEEIGTDLRRLSWLYDSMGRAYQRTGDANSGYSFYEQSNVLRMSMTPPDTLLIIASLNNLHGVLFQQGKTKEAIEKLMEAYRLSGLTLNEDHPYNIVLIDNLASMYKDNGEYEKGLKYAFKALSIKKKAVKNEDRSKLYKSYLYISNLYSKLFAYPKALNYLDTAHDIAIERGRIAGELMEVHINYSVLSQNIDEQINHLKEALKNYQKLKYVDKGNLAIIYNNIGVSYSDKGDLNQALNNYLKAVQIRESISINSKSRLATSYQNLASIYQLKNNLPLAIEFLEKAIKALNDEYKNDEVNVIEQKLALSMVCAQAGETERSLDLIEECLASHKKIRNRKDFMYSVILIEKARFFYKSNEDSKALKFALEAKTIADTIEIQSNFKKALLDQLLSLIYNRIGDYKAAEEASVDLLENFGFEKEKGKWLKKEVPKFSIAKGTGYYWAILKDKQNYNLEITDQEVDFGLELLNDMINQSYFESGDKRLQDKARNHINFSLEYYSKKYLESHKDEYLGKIYDAIEQARSINLNRGLRKKTLLKMIPDSILEKEQRIVVEYEIYYNQFNQLDDESLLKQKDAQDIKNKLIELQEEKEQLNDYISKHYPEYQALKSDKGGLSFDEIQNFSKSNDKQLIYFHWADSILYSLFIAGDLTDLQVIPTDSIAEEIKQFQSLISDRQLVYDELNFKIQKKDFSEKAESLFKKLIHSKFGLSNEKEILIIADGPLVNLPFEILLTKEVDSNMSYAQFPYLLKDYTISYLISSQQLMPKKAKQNWQYDYLGFAPNYKELAIQNKAFRSADMPLLENKKEILEVAKNFNSKYFIDETAVKTNFLDYAKDAKILHLAMHAAINDSFAYSSYLSFSNTSDSIPNKLYAFEIAQKILNNELVVLSACNTNVGDFQYGEGTQGIARSFQMAGSSNLILSHWLVDDQSSNFIIQKFFKHLSKDVSRSEALRQAKLDFLAQSNTFHAHPFFWASLNYNGHPSDNSGGPKFNWILGLFMLLGIGILVVLVKKRLISSSHI